MIKDQIKIDQNYKALRTTCFSCEQLGHILRDCPLIHYLDSKKQGIRLFTRLSLKEERRRKFHRKANKSKLNLFINNKYVKSKKKFKQILHDLDESYTSNSNPSSDSSSVSSVKSNISYSLNDKNNDNTDFKEHHSKNSNDEKENLKIISSKNDKNKESFFEKNSSHRKKSKKPEEDSDSGVDAMGESKRYHIKKKKNISFDMKESHGKVHKRTSLIPSFQTKNELKLCFEKIACYKNYFPDNNITAIIKKNEKKLDKNKQEEEDPQKKFIEFVRLKSQLEKKKTYRFSLFSSTNKVFPDEEKIEERNSSSRLAILPSKERKISNIFCENTKKRLLFNQNSKYLTFYDVVYQVLTNQDLRKNLTLMRMECLKHKENLKRKHISSK